MLNSNRLNTLPDQSGPAEAASLTSWITIAEATQQFNTAGIARNKRSLRRYCERGDLDCRKTENTMHQPQYFIDAASVETYIAQQKTLLASQPDVPGQVRSDPDETSVDHRDGYFSHGLMPDAGQPGHDRSSPDSAGLRRSGGGEVLIQLEARIADKDAEIAFLRSELLHRRTTDTALHDVIAAFRANAEAQRLSAAPAREEQGTTYQEPPQP